MSTHKESVDRWMADYGEIFKDLQDHAKVIFAAVQARLKDDGLNYHQVDHRIKDSASLKGKLLREKAGTPKYENGLSQIDDLIGLRVITFLNTDIDLVAAGLKGKFDCIEDTDKTEETRDSGAIGYAGRHLILRVPEVDPPDGCAGCKGQRFEVQLRTVLQHAWAEFEHDVRYKGSRPIPPRANRAFDVAGALIELADDQFASIQDLLAGSEITASEREVAHPVLAPEADEAELEVDASNQGHQLLGEDIQEVFLRLLPSHPRSKIEQYEWLAELVKANSIETKEEAQNLFAQADWDEMKLKMDYQFPAGHVRIADDFMLKVWGEEYINRTEDLGNDQQRRPKLEHRLRKLRAS